MFKLKSRRASVAALLGGVGGWWCALPAMAQDIAPAQGGLEEVLVTAQKRSERLQDVPITISVLGAEQLPESGITSLTQIAPRVPGFYGGSAGSTRPQLYIRGIGSRQFDAGSEASVGLFIDEVYIGRTAGTLGALRDIERIEVLKGPQGTLYGRNTIGGAVNVISKGPTDTLQAEVEAGAGNYEAYNYFAAVSGPLTESLKGRVAVWRTYSEGYMRNTFTGNHAQGVDNYGGRLRLDYAPLDNLTIGFTGELLRDDGYSFAGENEGNITNPNAVFLARAGATTVKTPDRYSDAMNFDNLLDRDVDAANLRADLNTRPGTLTSISAYRRNRAVDDRDFDNTALDVLRQVSDEDSEQFTQELRFTSDAAGPWSLDGRLDWIAGVFYYHDRSDRIDTFDFGLDSIPGFARGGRQTDVTAADYRTSSLAAFAQATWHVTDTLDLILGGRYTEDSKEAVASGTTTAPGLPLVAAPFATGELKKTFTSFDPRVTLSYQPTRNLNLYASYNQGFKSGGFQYLAFTAAQANVIFDPESLDAYEIGFKSQWLDNALTLNGAAFKYKYDDLQVLRVVAVPGGGAASLIVNAASSTIEGFEIDTTARLAENVEVNLAYAYTDAKYDSFPFNATTDFSNSRMVRAPVHSINVGAQWTIPFGDNSSLLLRADYAHLSKLYFEPGEGNPAFGTTLPLSAEPSSGLLDLRATFRYANFRISSFVSNAEDQYYRRTVLSAPGQLIGYPGAPRTYGVTVGWSY